MPVNPQIPLSVQNPQLQNPLEVMSTIAQLQGQREAAELRRLAAEEARARSAEEREKRAKQAAIDQALRAAIKVDEKTGRITFDKPKLVATLPGDLAYQAQKELDEDEVKANALASSLLKLEGEKRGYRDSIARTIRAAKYDPNMFRALMKGAHGFGALEDDVAAHYETLPDTDIQAIVDSYIAAKDEDFVAVKTVNAQGQEVTKFVRKEPGVEYPVAPSSAEGVSHQSEWVLLPGQSEPVLASYNPKTRELLHQGKDISAIARRVPPPPPQGPYMWAVPPGGEAPTLMTPPEIREAGAGQAPPPITEVQGKAAGYAGRLAQAEPTLTKLTTPVSAMNPVSFAAQTNSWFAQPTFQSNEIQQYMQSARNFINAVLRRESGAVISAQEFAEAKAQYLPVPGDTDDALALKKANREYVFETMRREAGRAYVAPKTDGGKSAPGLTYQDYLQRKGGS